MAINSQSSKQVKSKVHRPTGAGLIDAISCSALALAGMGGWLWLYISLSCSQPFP